MAVVRFRYSGKNWEGRAWRTAEGITSFGLQIEADDMTKHGTDGTVASKGHDANSPRSDHRPRPFVGAGIVRAIDVGVDSMSQGMGILEPLRRSRDPRTKYLIFHNSMFSSYPKHGVAPYTWRSYSGSNPHKTHFHHSTWPNADNDNKPWTIGTGGASVADMKVIDVQKALNEASRTDFEGKALTEDDEYGPRTHSALVKAYSNDGGPGAGAWARLGHSHDVTGKAT